jgi:hypothetical protein
MSIDKGFMEGGALNNSGDMKGDRTIKKGVCGDQP